MNQVFGAVGFTGAAVVMTVFLILGSRGGWKIKLSNEGVVPAAFITGQLYAQAGQNFAFLNDVSGGLSEAIQASFGNSGQFGAGGVAMLIVLFVYGMKPNKLRNGVLCLLLPSLFTAAGGLFATLTDLISNLTGTVMA